jgi:hypothetical protein
VRAVLGASVEAAPPPLSADVAPFEAAAALATARLNDKAAARAASSARARRFPKGIE